MKPKIICLTPVKNEAWILNTFLNAVSLWADHIIIADQGSTDGSREIAKEFSKVTLVDNPSPSFNEPERQKLLIDEARKIVGPKLLVALDADEFFTPNLLTSKEWSEVLESPPGTSILFQWANIRPDLKSMWLSDYFPRAYMDDNRPHNDNQKIHSSRLPVPTDGDKVEISTIKLIHLQYINWRRMKSKHRWYQCFELINFPDKSPLDIFRTYHHMDSVPRSELLPVPNDWNNTYKSFNIDMWSYPKENIFWWDEQILSLFETYGINFFRKIYIWDVNWKTIALNLNKKDISTKLVDPRGFNDALIHTWLRMTQNFHSIRFIRRIDRKIKSFFNY